jgi:fructokinase
VDNQAKVNGTHDVFGRGLSNEGNAVVMSVVALTRGPGGGLLLAYRLWSDHSGQSVAVSDAIGAGDAFRATLVVGLLAGRPLEEISPHANELAAFVCTRPGRTPALPDTLKYPVKLTAGGRP